MAPTDGRLPLQKHLLSNEFNENIAEAVWEDYAVAPTAKSTLQSYFEYCSTRCQRFLRDGGIHVSMKSPLDISKIIHMILKGQKRESIRTDVLKNSTRGGVKAVDTSIDLCASLVSMVEVGKHEFGLSGCNAIHWDDGSFENCLATHFQASKVLDAGLVRSESSFTAKNLNRIGGIRIIWTPNLVDHLLLTDDDRAVHIFPQASFLKQHQSSAQNIYPLGFIEETLCTLALLFPQNNPKTKQWLQSLIKAGQDGLDPGLGNCGSLRTQERRFEAFSFWHDRLVILKQAFDESKPQTLAQWWFDRRNGKQWYTFWIAVMVFVVTIIFGVVQSVEGGMQAYYSYKSVQGMGPNGS